MKALRFVFAAWMALSVVTWVPTAYASDPIVPADSIQGMKSGRTALLTSLLGTAVPVGLGILAARTAPESGGGGLIVLTGSVVGPSLGHFYAGRPGRAFAGIGLRTVAIVAVGGGLAMGWDYTEDEGAAILTVFGLGLWGGSTIFDIADAPKSARIHNERLARERLTITPTAIGPTRAPGLRVDWSL